VTARIRSVPAADALEKRSGRSTDGGRSRKSIVTSAPEMGSPVMESTTFPETCKVLWLLWPEIAIEQSITNKGAAIYRLAIPPVRVIARQYTSLSDRLAIIELTKNGSRKPPRNQGDTASQCLIRTHGGV
jgi:hypothetical protein